MEFKNTFDDHLPKQTKLFSNVDLLKQHSKFGLQMCGTL